MIAHGFFNVYAMCVDTLFLCFCKYSSVLSAWLRSYVIVQEDETTFILSQVEFAFFPPLKLALSVKLKLTA